MAVPETRKKQRPNDVSRNPTTPLRLTTNSRSRYLRFIEPLRPEVASKPEARLNILRSVLGTGVEDGFVVLRTERDIVEAYLTHGSGDVPPYVEGAHGTMDNIEDLFWYLNQGFDIYQYQIFKRKDGDDDLPYPPADWLSAQVAAKIKGVTPRTVQEYCKKDLLTAIYCRDGEWYIDPDLRFDYWLTQLPCWGATYFRLRLIQQILEEDDPQTVDEIYAGVSFLEEVYEVVIQGAYDRTAISTFLSAALGELPDTVEIWKSMLGNYIEYVETQVLTEPR